MARPLSLRTWAINLGLLMVSVITALALVEGTLRVTGYSPFVLPYIYDQYSGAKLRPHAEGWWREEGETYIQINSAGLRDREHSMLKPENTVRIAVLGDSYAEALQVSMENTFWAVLERQLNECHAFGPDKAEVINFGESGYGTAQELLTLRHRVWDYSPDIVLLAFVTGNDIADSYKPLRRIPQIPYFELKDDVLVLDDSFHAHHYEDAATSLKMQWALAAAENFKIAKLYFAFKARLSKVLSAQKPAQANVPIREVGLDDSVYLEPTGADWQEAWNVTEALVVRMRDEVKAKGARFLLVTLSNSIQVHPDPTLRGQFMKDLGINTLFYPDRRIKALADRENIDATILAPLFQGYAESHQVYLHGFANTRMGFGHWNERGHHLAGETIAEHVCRSTPSH
jgi:hypothetical protein